MGKILWGGSFFHSRKVGGQISTDLEFCTTPDTNPSITVYQNMRRRLLLHCRNVINCTVVSMLVMEQRDQEEKSLVINLAERLLIFSTLLAFCCRYGNR